MTPDPTPPAYRERLWPGPIVWLAAAGSIAALSIAYAAALGTLAGVLIATAGGTLALILIARSAAVLAVDEDRLRAGRASIGWEFTGRVLALDADRARTARGPDGDPSAFLLLRPGVGPGGVVIEVVDPSDPHRTWLIATRHPQQMVSAIEAARGRVLP